MCYNPRATTVLNNTTSGAGTTEVYPNSSTSICFDTSLFARDAWLVSGLNIVHRRHLTDIIGCISGGLKALLPLYVLLDKPEKAIEIDTTVQLSKSSNVRPSLIYRLSFVLLLFVCLR